MKCIGCFFIAVIIFMIVLMVTGVAQEQRPISASEVDKRMDVLRNLIDGGAPPLYIECVRLPFVVFVNYQIFGDAIRMSPSATNVAMRWMMVVVRLFFIAMAVNCFISDCGKARWAVDTVQEGNVQNQGAYCVWVVLVLVVMSPNYLNACAVWLFLARLSPSVYFSAQFKDFISAWRTVFNSGFREAALAGSNGVAMVPRYPAFTYFCYGVPLVPGGSKWLPLESHVYALVLLPYYFFTFLQVAAIKLGCCTWSCCQSCGGCFVALLLVMLSLGVSSQLRDALGVKWSTVWPIWLFVVITLWAWIASTFLSWVFSGLCLLGGRSCDALALHKQYRLVFLQEEYQPQLKADFDFDPDELERAVGEAVQAHEKLVNPDGEDCGFAMDAADLGALAKSLRCKILWDVTMRSANLLIVARTAVLIAVRYHTMSMGNHVSSDVLDAFALTLTERGAQQYVASVGARLTGALQSHSLGALLSWFWEFL